VQLHAAPDVLRRVDDQPLGRYPLLIAGLCTAIVFIDGFDAQIMGFVAPAVSAELHIPRAALGAVISSGTFGMLIGALVCGPLADRMGRKPVLVTCAFTFALGSLMTAGAASAAQLTACRAFTGMGMGCAMPNAIALTSEHVPARSRNAAVMTMFCGFSFGSAFAGWTTAAVISRFGWQAVFVVGGAIPILLAIVSITVLPGSSRDVLPRVASPAFSVRELFAAGRAAVTLFLWTMFFMNLLNLWFLNNWLPTILHDAGMRIETASVVTSLFQVGGLVGTLALAGLWARRLSFGMLACLYLAAAVLTLLIGEAGASFPLLASTVFACGMGVVGGQTAANELAAEFYPTAIRATGVGWALGIGRIGSILGPILGGALLSYGDARRAFQAASVTAFVAACAALGASVASRRRA